MTVALLLVAAALVWPGPPGHRAAFWLAAPSRTRATSAAHGRGWAPRWLERLHRRRPGQGGGENDDTLALLDRLAAGLRAGLPAGPALEAAAHASRWPAQVLAPALRAAQEGRSAASALSRAARLAEDETLARVARAWALSERTGAPLADAVESAARSGRQSLDHRRHVQAATAGARASVSLLTLLPLGGLPVGLLVGTSPGDLYGSPATLACLALGVVLLLAGRLLVARMVRRVETL